MDWWKAVLNAVMSLQIPYNAGISLLAEDLLVSQELRTLYCNVVVMDYIILYYIILYYTILYYIILYYIILYYIILYYIILYLFV